MTLAQLFEETGALSVYGENRRLDFTGIKASRGLPGKRSICDHLEEIVDYIKDMRKNMEELACNRERLKEMRNICSSDHNSHLAAPSSSMKSDDDQDRILVKKCKEGVEISVISNLEGGLALTKVLRVLMEEWLLVISCVSSKINQKERLKQ
uniref:Transcription factor bHLH126-like n=1 Tax=Nicotiana tabacum TaxID=4097 RepID=A0A1S3XMM4_TOBAC|nr:PREDICTED: transcription factor bHLH126-like [Nicotiana tabacum]